MSDPVPAVPALLHGAEFTDTIEAALTRPRALATHALSNVLGRPDLGRRPERWVSGLVSPAGATR